jgi:hypothetical protein
MTHTHTQHTHIWLLHKHTTNAYCGLLSMNCTQDIPSHHVSEIAHIMILAAFCDTSENATLKFLVSYFPLSNPHVALLSFANSPACFSQRVPIILDVSLIYVTTCITHAHILTPTH